MSVTTMPENEPSIRPVVTCDMGAVSEPDLETLDALCRFHMAVAQMGYVLRLKEATERLDQLLTLCGLDQSFSVDQGQAKEGEETVGVEEEIEPGNPPA
jgi:anti-anti-sigma regulatory factor